MDNKKTVKKKKPDVTVDKISIPLEDRNDLFNKWVIKDWLNNKENSYSLKTIFFELFLGLYDDLTEKYDEKKRDEIFVNFINIVFPTVLDVYKLHESEKNKMDIGLLRALKDIPECEWYIELLTSFSNMYDKK